MNKDKKKGGEDVTLINFSSSCLSH